MKNVNSINQKYLELNGFPSNGKLLMSYLYTCMRIAGVRNRATWGFDETKIDGHDTFNQWAMLIDPTQTGNV